VVVAFIRRSSRMGAHRRETGTAESPPGPLEVVPPRLNEKGPTAVENLLQALALDVRQPFSLELAGEPGKVRFLVRASTSDMRAHLAGQLRLAYPQAELRDLGGSDDPLSRCDGLSVVASELRLRAGNHLPLKDWQSDREWR